MKKMTWFAFISLLGISKALGVPLALLFSLCTYAGFFVWLVFLRVIFCLEKNLYFCIIFSVT